MPKSILTIVVNDFFGYQNICFNYIETIYSVRKLQKEQCEQITQSSMKNKTNINTETCSYTTDNEMCIERKLKVSVPKFT